MHHLSSKDGLSQLWVNGKATIKRFVSTVPIVGAPIIILGQDQEYYGGGFEGSQSFIGMITQVHMWDYVFLPPEIKRYADGRISLTTS